MGLKMDENVISAMAKWPNVPAVFGWLSLSARGQWLIHPDGLATTGSTGQAITSEQILGFIRRNYAGDAQGRWFFQNGPQRVFVRLDGAPLIVSVDDAHGVLVTHTQKTIQSVSQWWVSSTGSLYLHSDLGPGLILDRDLVRLADRLSTSTGLSLSEWFAHDDTSAHGNTDGLIDTSAHFACCASAARLSWLDSNKPVDEQLGFIANPIPDTTVQ
jgi:hypothetical protein